MARVEQILEYAGHTATTAHSVEQCEAALHLLASSLHPYNHIMLGIKEGATHSHMYIIISKAQAALSSKR